jgi:hypothetical protein
MGQHCTFRTYRKIWRTYVCHPRPKQRIFALHSRQGAKIWMWVFSVLYELFLQVSIDFSLKWFFLTSVFYAAKHKTMSRLVQKCAPKKHLLSMSLDVIGFGCRGPLICKILEQNFWQYLWAATDTWLGQLLGSPPPKKKIKKNIQKKYPKLGGGPGVWWPPPPLSGYLCPCMRDYQK